MSTSDVNINVYGMIPNRGGNLAALICFAILWGWNTVAGIYTKQWWFGTAFFIGCGLEVAGYIGRFLSNGNPYNLDYFLVQIICLSLAPAFFMAGVYYLLAKFAIIYGSGVSRLKPMTYSYLFVSCDLVSIVLQAIGGGMSAMALIDKKSTDPGTHVMVAGLAVQVAATTLFFVLCFDFMFSVYKKKKAAKADHPLLTSEEIDSMLFEPKYADIRQKKPMYNLFICAIVICSTLIFVRCIYRLCELAEGWSGPLLKQEGYFLVLEALVVAIGVLCLSVIHPGFALGKNMNIPVKDKKQQQKNDDVEGQMYSDERTIRSEESLAEKIPVSQ